MKRFYACRTAKGKPGRKWPVHLSAGPEGAKALCGAHRQSALLFRIPGFQAGKMGARQLSQMAEADGLDTCTHCFRIAAQ